MSTFPCWCQLLLLLLTVVGVHQWRAVECVSRSWRYLLALLLLCRLLCQRTGLAALDGGPWYWAATAAVARRAEGRESLAAFDALLMGVSMCPPGICISMHRLIQAPPKNNSKARGHLVLERKQLRIRLKGAYVYWGGAYLHN